MPGLPGHALAPAPAPPRAFCAAAPRLCPAPPNVLHCTGAGALGRLPGRGPALHRRRAVEGPTEAPPTQLGEDGNGPKSIVEVAGNGETRRFLLTGASSSPLAAYSRKPPPGEGVPSLLASSGVVSAIKALMLPKGYPATVTEDYLRYQAWMFPTHVTGMMQHSITTASLLQAVGISAGPASTVATGAAIKWLTKDGLGSIGRLVVGGQRGAKFDEDPCQWRLYAEGLATAGSFLELSTAFAPQHFFLLASLGNLSKGLGRGMGKPSFRVIQNHFAANNNLGDVAAKEEVWEVFSQLVGLGLSVLLLEYTGAQGDGASAGQVVATWLALVGSHVGLRYVGLKQVTFNTLNFKRALILTRHYVDTGEVLSPRECAALEPILVPASTMLPGFELGCGVDGLLELLAPAGVEGGGAEELRETVSMHAGEGHIVAWAGEGGAARVALAAPPPAAGGGAGSAGEGEARAAVRALLQVAWLERHGGETSSTRAAGGGRLGVLRASVAAMREAHGPFEDAARAAGWELSRVTIRTNDARVRF